MNRRAEGPRRWRVGVLASIGCLGAVLAVLAGQGSAGATPNKPFAVVICTPGQSCPPGSPPVVTPGVTTATGDSLTAVVTDETSTGTGLQIGSVNLTVPSGPTPPSGITIVSASVPNTPPIAACTPTTPATTSCFTGSVLELRSLSIPPGGSLDVSIGIDTPTPPSSCTNATPAPCQWSATAKQSNDFNGPPGNQLNLDPGTSQLGVAVSSVATCTAAKKPNTCSTTLADGGTTGSTAGSVSITTTATGTTAGTFFQAIDYASPPTAAECSGVNSDHYEYISGPALNGANARSFQVTINTTDMVGYQSEVCIFTSQEFLAKVPGSAKNEPAPFVTQPDGTQGFVGLLPDCNGGTAPTVNCNTLPGVVSRSTSPDGTVHTIVASFPAGFDLGLKN